MLSELEKAKDLIDNATRISVLSGAGISTASGIPDFRGPEGVWTKNPGAEKLSTIDHYIHDETIRKRSWETYVTKNEWANATPNDGHLGLKTLDDRGKLLHIATQNIDGLHHASGVDSDKISELHGTLRWIVCIDCGWRIDRSTALYYLAIDSEEYDGPPPCPKCSDAHCTGMLKPDIIYFGENLPSVAWDKAEAAALSCDLYISIGTSLQVWPAANLPLIGCSVAPYIIINAAPTDQDIYADVVINDDIGKVLQWLVS